MLQKIRINTEQKGIWLPKTKFVKRAMLDIDKKPAKQILHYYTALYKDFMCLFADNNYELFRGTIELVSKNPIFDTEEGDRVISPWLHKVYLGGGSEVLIRKLTHLCHKDETETMLCGKCGFTFYRWKYYRCPNCWEGH